MKLKIFSHTVNNLNYNKPINKAVQIPDNTQRLKQLATKEKVTRICELFIRILDKIEDNNKKLLLSMKKFSIK